MIGIAFIIIAVIILFMINFLTTNKNELVQYPGVGVIKKRIQEDCRINFYVEFRDTYGKVHIGRSITYKSTKGKYYEGDTANIKYYFTPKGRALVRIEDNDLISCEQESKPIISIMFIVSVALIVLGIVCLVLL